jgi:hypothetical protein
MHYWFVEHELLSWLSKQMLLAPETKLPNSAQFNSLKVARSSFPQ